MSTLQDTAADSLIKNGIIAPGEAIPAEWADLAVRDSNRICDDWNIQQNFVWTINILTFALTARTLPQYWFTIGPHSVDPTTDFDAPRPTRIERANLLLESSSPASRVPLTIYDDQQWSDQTVPALGTTIPTSIYDDYADPVSKLYVWPYPTVTQNQLELFVWNQISRFSAITDTFQMPPGYEGAFMLTLSERLCAGIKPVPPDVAAAATKARAAVRSLNSQAPKMSTTDSGMPGRPRSLGNFYNGWPSQLP